MTTIAHIRNGEIIRLYKNGKGRVTLLNGDTVSPPVVGYVNGPDRIVPLVVEETDTSTSGWTTTSVADTVENERVLRVVTITDMPIEQRRETALLDRFTFALLAAKGGFISFPEAAAWAAGNVVPAAVQEIIEALPIELQGPVTLDVLAKPTVRRVGILMPAIAVAFGTDDQGLDRIFGIA